jgi:ketosteroid isomerase-like protein
MKRIVFAVGVAVLVFGVAVLAQPQAGSADLQAAKVAVNSVLDQWMQIFETENLGLFSKLFAHDPDMVNFGTDAAERFVGYESLENSIKKQFESTEETKVTSRERVIKVHKSGEVAWISLLWDQKGKAQGQPYSVEGMRLTGILEKRNGSWVIVQVHASVPVSGQAIKY